MPGLNFGAGQTRANNAIAELATDGAGTIKLLVALLGGGTAHVLVNVNGYFE